MIKWEQMVFLGNPEFGVQLQPIDFVKFAEACGGAGFRIENPVDCGAIMDEALKVDGPVLIEGVVDPLEPPLPPNVTRDQAVKFAESLVRGEPDRVEIARTALSNVVRQLT
jgi:pyruvate dehydrogenase (quinone)/pyruvate oxidase